jgi:molecular chaperone GrpE
MTNNDQNTELQTPEEQFDEHIQPELSPLEVLEQQVAEWKDLAQRKAAEVDNIRRRSQQREAELLLHASERTVKHLLPVLDDVQSALQATSTGSDTEALRTGIAMIAAKTQKLFEECGVKQIEITLGQPFDVDHHEALMMQPSEFAEGSVVATIQPGYTLHGKVIRHAKVITSSGEQP